MVTSAYRANDGAPPQLIRGIGLFGATTLNMIDMIGVGPFITIPLIVAAMGGPQAMLGWIVGAALVMCDGLVWAELGAAMPHSGGSYRYLKEIYNPAGFGKFMAFLFIWQLTFSAPLSIASGCIGFAQYAQYLVPGLGTEFFQHDFQLALPLLGTLELKMALATQVLVAMGICAVAIVLLYRRINIIARISEYLWIGVLLSIGWIIYAGVTHFDSSRAFSFPPGAFTLSNRFFQGLGTGMLVALYDYWGYYNVCFLGDEIREPGKTIPRAIIISIALVAVMYLIMNISILGVIPWQELSETAGSDARRYVVSVFMERLYGQWAGNLATILIMWTAFASVFSLLLGYSRIPFAAAREGDFFRPFARIHPTKQFPNVSLVVLGVLAMAFCSLTLSQAITALAVIRLIVQFLAQTIGVIMLRIRKPGMDRPFRMWFYPLPALVAAVGFVYTLIVREKSLTEIRYAVGILALGSILFLARSWKTHDWPFRKISVSS
ncbi:MAG TPA: APC family permease [Bacteroidota bacterium]|nr:APC family permease [Bacteroidota bacterium]